MVYFVRLLVCCALLWSSTTLEIPSAIKSQPWRAVRLAENRKDGFHFVASGFILVRAGKTYVVTSAHVLEKVSNRTQFYADFEKPVEGHLAVVLSTDEVSDIAL